jgi:hypothetical protein
VHSFHTSVRVAATGSVAVAPAGWLDVAHPAP